MMCLLREEAPGKESCKNPQKTKPESDQATGSNRHFNGNKRDNGMC